MLADGLDELIEYYSVVGITTNPTIFASVLARGDRYDEQLGEELEREGIHKFVASWGQLRAMADKKMRHLAALERTE